MDENDLDSSAGDPGHTALYVHWRQDSHAPVELAAAGVVWLAHDHLLASDWTSGAVPDPLWRIWTRMPRFPSLPYAPSPGRTLRKHDSGGAGKIPATHARTLGLRSSCGRKQRVMKDMTGE